MMPFQAMRLRQQVSAVTYLDSLSTLPRMVLSLRKLISTATSAIRVRRSSDNAEQDIGFSANSLDTASLASFVGSNSAYVVTIYDQTGNGEHATQATTTKQPRIMNAGTYDGKMIFSGAQGMKVTSLTLGTPQVGLYSTYRHAPDASGTQVVAEMTTVGSSNSGTFLIYTNADSSFLDSYNTSGPTNHAIQMVPATTMAQQTYLMDRSLTGSAELAVFIDGASRSTSTPVMHEQTDDYLTNDMYLGARSESTFFSTIELIDFVVYNADTSSIRTDIEAII